MKHLIVAFLLALLANPVAAQVSVMVRTDRTDLATEKNVPNSLEKVQQRAAAKGGTWETLLANDTTCGGGAVAIAYSAKTIATARYLKGITSQLKDT